MAVAIPGMASFMEETNIELEVSTTDEAVETEAEAVEAADAAEDVQEEVAENEETTNEAEMLFHIFDQCERMEAYVNKYGVDRQFLFMNNTNDELANMLGITLPACESFDVTGDPKSSTSIACCEGFKEIAKKVWEVIKNFFKKIGAFFSRLVEAVKRRYFSLEANIGRLRKMWQERADDPEKLKGAKGAVVSKEVCEKISTEGTKVISDLEKDINDVKKLIDGIDATNGQKFSESIEKADKDLNDREAAVKKIKQAIKSDRKEGNLSKIAWASIPSMLDAAAAIVKQNDKMQKLLDDAKRGSDYGLAKAQKAEALGDKGADENVRVAKQAARLWGRFSNIVGKAIAMRTASANEIVRSCSMRIAAGSKKV